jgi:hypothetical protein
MLDQYGFAVREIAAAAIVVRNNNYLTNYAIVTCAKCAMI